MNEFKSFTSFQKEEHMKDHEIRSEKQLTDTFVISETESMKKEDEGIAFETPNGLRKKHEISNKIRLYLFVVAGIIFLALLLMIICPIPFGQVIVNGSDNVTKDDVIFEGQIKTPINVLQISTADLEEKLKHDIRVDEVQVTRQFPATIEVNITERKAIAIMQGEFTYVFIDKSGRVIQSEVSIKSDTVPMITGKRLGNVLLGDTITDKDVLKALTFFNSLTSKGQDLFSELNIGNVSELKVYTREGISVHLGDGRNLKEQAELAENMVNDVRARHLSVEYLDANITSPFIKLKK